MLCTSISKVLPLSSGWLEIRLKTFENLQNFFKDSWNTFDSITVIGSIIDVLVVEYGVSDASSRVYDEFVYFLNTLSFPAFIPAS